MITNERQLRITKAELRQFEQAIRRAESKGPRPGLDPRLHAAMIEGLQSEVDVLRGQVEDYEQLRSGRVRGRALKSLLDLPLALIEARISRQLTQKQLAHKVGLPEQQIQRYEATRYSGVSLERLQEIAQALGVRLRGIDFGLPQESSRRRSSAARRTATGSSRRVRSRTAAKRAKAPATASKGGTKATAKTKTAKPSPSSTAKPRSIAKTTASAKRAGASRATASKSTTKSRGAASGSTRATSSRRGSSSSSSKGVR